MPQFRSLRMRILVLIGVPVAATVAGLWLVAHSTATRAMEDAIAKRLSALLGGEIGARDAADATWAAIRRGFGLGSAALVARVRRHHGPDGLLARPWPTGVMVLWTTVMLAAYLILFYL